MSFRIDDAVRRHLGDALKGLPVELMPAGPSEVLVIGKNFAIAFVADFDCVAVDFIQCSKRFGGVRQYCASSLLWDIHQKHGMAFESDFVSSREDALEASTRWACRVLKEGGGHILAGDFSWLNHQLWKDPFGYSGVEISNAAVQAINSSRLWDKTIRFRYC
jgi:hypothetical protein